MCVGRVWPAATQSLAAAVAPVQRWGVCMSVSSCVCLCLHIIQVDFLLEQAQLTICIYCIDPG